MVEDLIDPSFIFPIVRFLLTDWEEPDVRRYFELAYQDADMSLYVRTDSSRAAQAIADGFARMLVERMKVLQAREERALLEERRRLLLEE